MKIRRVALIVTSFIAGVILMSIPVVWETSNNVFHYLFASNPPLSGGGIKVSWADARKLIIDGEVRSIVLPHSGRITMVLHNGLQFQAQEPELGAASKALQEAPNRRWISVAIE